MAALAAAVGAAGLCAGRVAANQAAPSVYQRQTDGPGAGAAEAPTDTSTDTPAAATSAAPATAAVEDAAAQAERIVVSSLGVIARAPSFAVKIRQKARVGDRVLVGTGRYLQSGEGEEQRFRFDSTLTCDSETFEFTEVSDGLFCWTHRHNGEEPPSLQRIDVRRVRGKLLDLKAPDAADGASYLGGLQRMIRLMRHWFRFTKATPIDLDGQPVWVVEGGWHAAFLPIVLPQLKAKAATPGGIGPADMPDGMPWQVRLSIGRSDLIPRRIEWLAIPGTRPVADGPLETIAVLDLYDAEINGPVDATAFFYQPATEGLIDVTEMYVTTLGLMR